MKTYRIMLGKQPLAAVAATLYLSDGKLFWSCAR